MNRHLPPTRNPGSGTQKPFVHFSGNSGFYDHWSSGGSDLIPDPNLSIQLSRALIDRDQAAARKIADSFFSRYLETANTQEARKLTTILLCEVYVALLDFGDDIPDTQLSPTSKSSKML